MKCTNCNTDLPSDAMFCPNCGRAAKQSKPSNTTDKILVILVAAIAMLAVIIGGIVIGYNIFVKNSTLKDKNNENEQITASQSPMPTATEQAMTLTTHYVVNCNDSIALRKTPEANGEKIKDIPLSAPVSYITAAQNGFAEVIYEGTKGYALQAYLSPTQPQNDTNVNTNTVIINESNSVEVENNDQNPERRSPKTYDGSGYEAYYDSEYGFYCSYPVSYRVYNDSDSFVRYSLKSPDGKAILKICATERSGRSSQTIKDNFVKSYPGTIDYQDGGKDWCVISTYAYGQRHYGYFNMRGGAIRGFEFHSSYDYDTNDFYINKIYDSLKFDWGNP